MSTELELFERVAAMKTLVADKNAPEATPPVPLAKEIRRAGMVYTEIFRKGDIAVYCAKGKGQWIEYEVFRVQVLPAEQLSGRHYPLRESFLSSSEWGESGWTFTASSHRDPLAAALAKARHIANTSRIQGAEPEFLRGPMSDNINPLNEEALFDVVDANGNVSAPAAKECARGLCAVQDRYEEERKIVDILWAFFGDPSYEWLSDLVTETQDENKRLRESVKDLLSLSETPSPEMEVVMRLREKARAALGGKQ
jgi:hypothetical protein